MSTPEELGARPVRLPDHTVRYGDQPQQVADVWLPPSDSTAQPDTLLLFLHGGFWRAAYDRNYVAPLVDMLAQAGFAVANVEYRRVGDGGGVPTTFDDVAVAVDALPGQVIHNCGVPDRARVIVGGHSAGGHLALWTSGRHLLPSSSRWFTDTPIRGVLSIAAVCSVAAALADDLGDGAAGALLGESDALAEVDPSALGPTGVPTALVHGRRDERVPFSYSAVHRGLLTAGGTPAWLWDIPDAGHFEPVDPATAASSTVHTALEKLCPRAK